MLFLIDWYFGRGLDWNFSRPPKDDVDVYRGRSTTTGAWLLAAYDAAWPMERRRRRKG